LAFFLDRFLPRALCAAVVLAMAAGCNRTATLHGAVVDVQGHALPGVAVTVVENGAQSVTDGVGRYGDRGRLFIKTDIGWTVDFARGKRLPAPQGRVHVDFIKTGYTTGHIALDVDGFGPVEVRPVMLFPLPQRAGVYVYQNHQYREMIRTRPKRYSWRASESEPYTPTFGVELDPETQLSDPAGILLFHLLPDYDVALHRLERREVVAAQDAVGAPEGGAFTQQAWVPDTRIPAAVIPVDEPERTLIELRPDAPLASGVYGVHWGALEGYFTTEPMVYLFTVPDPDAPAEAEGEGEGEGEVDGEDRDDPIA